MRRAPSVQRVRLRFIEPGLARLEFLSGDDPPPRPLPAGHLGDELDWTDVREDAARAWPPAGWCE